jgi:hypothetical protein
MAAASFDPTHAVRFDLPRGRVSAGDGERLLLVPLSAVEAIALSATPEAVEALGRALGAAIGKRAAVRLGADQGATIEAFVTQLAGEAAIAGVGTLGVERWGRALVVVVEGSPLSGPLLGPLVAAAIEAASGRRVWTTLLSRDEATARIFVGSENGTARIREWLASGVAWADAVARLQGEGGRA